MGTRHILTVYCPNCHGRNEDVYYAPTCDFTTHRCEACDFEIDLERYTGTSYEGASNRAEIECIIDALRDGDVRPAA